MKMMSVVSKGSYIVRATILSLGVLEKQCSLALRAFDLKWLSRFHRTRCKMRDSLTFYF